MFWDREGNPIDSVLEWAMMFENSEFRIVSVDQDAPGTPMVSTAWQGIDISYSIHPDAIPMIFETAWLVPDETGAGHLQERWLSATEVEALATHAKVCRERLGREPEPDNGRKRQIIEEERKGLR